MYHWNLIPGVNIQKRNKSPRKKTLGTPGNGTGEEDNEVHSRVPSRIYVNEMPLSRNAHGGEGKDGPCVVAPADGDGVSQKLVRLACGGGHTYALMGTSLGLTFLPFFFLSFRKNAKYSN